jgi:hypothetical protein
MIKSKQIDCRVLNKMRKVPADCNILGRQKIKSSELEQTPEAQHSERRRALCTGGLRRQMSNEFTFGSSLSSR